MKRRVTFVCVAVSVLALQGASWAAQRFWVSDAASNWNNSTNWSTTSNGGGGAGVPGVADTTIFDAGGTGQCNVDADPSIAGIRFDAAYPAQVVTGIHTFTVTSKWITPDSYNPNVFIGDDGANRSTVRITGDAEVAVSSWQNRFGDLEIASTGKTVTLLTDLRVENNLIFNGGTVTDNGAGREIIWYTNKKETDNLTVAAGTVMDFAKIVFNGNGFGATPPTDTVLIPAYAGYPALAFAKHSWGSNVFTLSGAITCARLELNASDTTNNMIHVNLNNQTLTCSEFILGESGYPNKYLVDIGSGTLDVNGPCSLYYPANDSSSVNMGTGSIRVSGAFNNAGVPITKGSSTLFLDGTSGTQGLRSGGKQFHHVTFQNGATRQLIGNNLSVGGNLTVSGGVVDLSGRNVTVSGNLTVNGGSGTFAAGSLNNRKIIVGGACSLNGQSGSLLNLNSTAPCTLAVTGALTANYANIANNRAHVSAGSANTSTDGGGNTNWTFNVTCVTPVVSNPSNQSVTDGQTATFTVAASTASTPPVSYL